MNLAEKIISFNTSLKFTGKLPENIRIMNPFLENPNALEVSSNFYRKFYNDNNARTLILGINPGRLGAGVTGIPFTDTKRLIEICKLKLPNVSTHEPSSVFVYEVIEAYGGVTSFYNNFYINSVCPLGFVIENKNGSRKNYNYYDSKDLQNKMKPFIIETIQKQISFGIKTEVCFCLGSGKNYKFLNELNKEMGFFEKIVPLDHPRYVMQYKAKHKEEYLDKFLKALKKNRQENKNK